MVYITNYFVVKICRCHAKDTPSACVFRLITNNNIIGIYCYQMEHYLVISDADFN